MVFTREVSSAALLLLQERLPKLSLTDLRASRLPERNRSEWTSTICTLYKVQIV